MIPNLFVFLSFLVVSVYGSFAGWVGWVCSGCNDFCEGVLYRMMVASLQGTYGRQHVDSIPYINESVQNIACRLIIFPGSCHN